jgi:hypothetical protein
LLATFGTDHVAMLCIFYVYGLGSALLLGSLEVPAAVNLATGIWTAGALATTAVAAAAIRRFTLSALELMLPSYGLVLLRSYALLLGLIPILPIVLFRIFIPQGHQLVWVTLVTPRSTLEHTLRSHDHKRPAVGRAVVLGDYCDPDLVLVHERIGTVHPKSGRNFR